MRYKLLVLASILLATTAHAKEPKAYQSGKVMQMDSVKCGVDEKDAKSLTGEMLGTEGVQKIVRETALLPFGDMQQAMLNRVAAWRDGAPTDDMSLVLLEVS